VGQDAAHFGGQAATERIVQARDGLSSETGDNR
jgi:hypothetical protein